METAKIAAAVWSWLAVLIFLVCCRAPSWPSFWTFYRRLFLSHGWASRNPQAAQPWRAMLARGGRSGGQAGAELSWGTSTLKNHAARVGINGDGLDDFGTGSSLNLPPLRAAASGRHRTTGKRPPAKRVEPRNRFYRRVESPLPRRSAACSPASNPSPTAPCSSRPARRRRAHGREPVDRAPADDSGRG